MSNRPAPPQFPPVIRACLLYLLRMRSVPETLFVDTDPRNALMSKKLLQSFQDGDNVVLDSFTGVVVGGLMKRWLNQLRGPLVPPRFLDIFLNANDLNENRERLNSIRSSLRLLPQANYMLLERLSFLFFRVTEAQTGPTAEELAALFALVIIWPPSDDSTNTSTSTTSSSSSSTDGTTAPPVLKGGGSSKRVEELMLVVNVPALNMSSKQRFSPTTTIAEALLAIKKKVRQLGDGATDWKVWLPAPKNVWADPNHTFQQYSMQSGDVIVIKQSDVSHSAPPYLMAAADIWLALIREYAFIFQNGPIRFQTVQRVPVARNEYGGTIGFRKRKLVTADALAREIEEAAGIIDAVDVSKMPHLNISSTKDELYATFDANEALSPKLQHRLKGAPDNASTSQQQQQQPLSPPSQRRAAPLPPPQNQKPPLVSGNSNNNNNNAKSNSARGAAALPPPMSSARSIDDTVNIYDSIPLSDETSGARYDKTPLPFSDETVQTLLLEFNNVDVDTIKDVLQYHGGNINLARQFLQLESDGAVAQQQVFSTMQIKIRNKPPAPLPPGVTGSNRGQLTNSGGPPAAANANAAAGSPNVLTLGPPKARRNDLTDSDPPARPKLARAPLASSNLGASSPLAAPRAAPRAAAIAGGANGGGGVGSFGGGSFGANTQQQQDNSNIAATAAAAAGDDGGGGGGGYGGVSKTELFREIAHLNREVKRLTAENRELVTNGVRADSSAVVSTLQAQVDELTQLLEEVRERCTCGAARYTHRKKKDVNVQQSFN